MGLCASSDSTSSSPHVDLSHFEILRVLGRGGFGKVNAIERKSDKKVFAIKAISKTMLLEKESNIYMCWLERKVMSQFTSPFLVNCIHAFQDDQNLYLVMPLMAGGDLRFYLKNQGGCNEEETKFYMAEMILALEEMHSLRIIDRDIKPDNMLLDEDGHIRISDFGLAAQIKSKDGKTSGYCGTKGYIAAEVASGQRYSYSCDYYSLGVVMYELLHRSLPSKQGGAVPVSSRLSQPCRHLLKGLLSDTPEKRWGCRQGDNGWQTIKECEWFNGLSWDDAKNKKLIPPFKPNVTIANCDPIFELEEQIMNSGNEKKKITMEQQKHFVGWEFRTIPVKMANGSTSENAYEDDQLIQSDFTQKAMEYARGKADSSAFQPKSPVNNGKKSSIHDLSINDIHDTPAVSNDLKENVDGDGIGEILHPNDLHLELGTEEEIRKRMHSTVKPNQEAEEKEGKGKGAGIKRKPTGITATLREGKGDNSTSPSTDPNGTVIQPSTTPKTGNESDPTSPQSPSVGRVSESMHPSKQMDMLEISTGKGEYSDDNTPDKSPRTPNILNNHTGGIVGGNILHDAEAVGGTMLEVPMGGKRSRANSGTNGNAMSTTEE